MNFKYHLKEINDELTPEQYYNSESDQNSSEDDSQSNTLHASLIHQVKFNFKL